MKQDKHFSIFRPQLPQGGVDFIQEFRGIIGRRGRVAQAIRTVVRAAGAGEGVDAQVDIVD